MEILGYTERLTVPSGDSLAVMVSSAVPYRAELVRLIHGDPNPAGPGFKYQAIPSELNGYYEGTTQALAHGSYVEVADAWDLRGLEGVQVVAYISPTFICAAPQGVVTKFDRSRSAGWGLMLDRDLGVSFWLGGEGEVERAATGRPLRLWAWYRVEAKWDRATGETSVTQTPVRRHPADETAARIDCTLRPSIEPTEVPLLIGAFWDGQSVEGHFNGKIDGPDLRTFDGTTVACWDFSLGMSGSTVTDSSGMGHHGSCVNRPMRAVTGAGWSGREVDWRQAPGEYSAIHFHEDDLADAGWKESLRVSISEEFVSGFYAVKVTTDSDEDYIPFLVVPGPQARRKKIAVLAPTFSYLAYANNHFSFLLYGDDGRDPACEGLPADLATRLGKEDHATIDLRLLSLYDRHVDGSGCCYASFRRPLLNMRPGYRHPRSGAPHQLGADLHLIDWLEERQFEYDVITDEILHQQGRGLLDAYTVVVTGSHPEYWTAAMLDALQDYLNDGGRLMYLGGNGFYWVISVDSEHPHTIEVRRGLRGTGTWRSEVGEGYHQMSGEPGGIWRDRGRAPQRIVGVGMVSESFDAARPYERAAGSFEDRAAFIFDGVPEDALIGERGLVLGGAAGFEIDRADSSLGTPPRALVLATARGFSDGYQRVIEEVPKTDPHQGGTESPHVRSDMLFFETPGGGAVFSTGSIAWCGALSSNGYDNHVSRITENVLRRFASTEPFEPS